MYAAEVTAASKAAAGKRAMLSKNPIGYFVLSMLAGAYIGFGNILINVIGGQPAGSPATKTVMSVPSASPSPWSLSPAPSSSPATPWS